MKLQKEKRCPACKAVRPISNYKRFFRKAISLIPTPVSAMYTTSFTLVSVRSDRGLEARNLMQLPTLPPDSLALQRTGDELKAQSSTVALLPLRIPLPPVISRPEIITFIILFPMYIP